MLKTFWTGVDVWADQQLPDGAVVWTAPTGKKYKTLPGTRIFFPEWMNGRKLRKGFAAGEPVRDEHDVARPFA